MYRTVSKVSIIQKQQLYGINANVRYDNLFRFPQTVLQSFQTVTGWSGNTTVDPNLYIAEPGLNYPQMTGFNGSLIFTLDDGYEVEIPNDELSNPLRGIDTNGARVLQPNITEVGIFYQEAPLNTAVLGKVFLSQVSCHAFAYSVRAITTPKVYLAVDYTINQFMLAPIVPSPIYADLVPFNSTSAACSASTGTSRLSTKAKVGIAIGTAVGVPFVVAVIAFSFEKPRHWATRRWEALRWTRKSGHGLNNGNDGTSRMLPIPLEPPNSIASIPDTVSERSGYEVHRPMIIGEEEYA